MRWRTITSSCVVPSPRWWRSQQTSRPTLRKAEFIAAQFRDRLDNGRKVAIQILEFFDRHGVTMRRGDLRRINQHRLDLFRRPADETSRVLEENRPRWGVRTSNPGGAARRSLVGSTPFSSATHTERRMKPSFLDALKHAADGAEHAEAAFRRDFAQRIKARGEERAFAYRRLIPSCARLLVRSRRPKARRSQLRTRLRSFVKSLAGAVTAKRAATCWRICAGRTGRIRKPVRPACVAALSLSRNCNAVSSLRRRDRAAIARAMVGGGPAGTLCAAGPRSAILLSASENSSGAPCAWRRGSRPAEPGADVLFQVHALGRRSRPTVDAACVAAAQVAPVPIKSRIWIDLAADVSPIRDELAFPQRGPRRVRSLRLPRRKK